MPGTVEKTTSKAGYRNVLWEKNCAVRLGAIQSASSDQTATTGPAQMSARPIACRILPRPLMPQAEAPGGRHPGCGRKRSRLVLDGSGDETSHDQGHGAGNVDRGEGDKHGTPLWPTEARPLTVRRANRRLGSKVRSLNFRCDRIATDEGAVRPFGRLVRCQNPAIKPWWSNPHA